MSNMELTLTEENEIGFQLRIEGSDKDISSSKPIIRFTLTESSTGRGWIFPTTKTDDGVSVVIPEMKGIISENKDYQGKLEIVLGGRYFEPTIVDINFIEPLKVEAAVATIKKHSNSKVLEEVATNKSNVEQAKELTVESKVKVASVKKETAPVEQPITFKSLNEDKELKEVDPYATAILEIISEDKKPTTYNDLSTDQKDVVNKMFLGKCEEHGVSQKDVKKLMKEGTAQTKKRLQALLAMSFKEYIER